MENNIDVGIITLYTEMSVIVAIAFATAICNGQQPEEQQFDTCIVTWLPEGRTNEALPRNDPPPSFEHKKIRESRCVLQLQRRKHGLLRLLKLV